MALTDTVETQTSPSDEPASRNLLGSWWVIVGFAVLLLLALGWQLLLHPTWTAPTRDPAWYTIPTVVRNTPARPTFIGWSYAVRC